MFKITVSSIIFISLLASTSAMSQTNKVKLLDEHFEIQLKNMTNDQNQAEKELVNANSMPEITLKSGLGSLKDFDQEQASNGPYLYVEGKYNIYRGGIAHSLLEQSELRIRKGKIENNILSRKILLDIFNKLTEIKVAKEENAICQNEIKENEFLKKFAIKKVNAGLNTSIDIMDFQIKNQNLIDLIEINILSIETKSKEIEGMFFNKYPFEELQKVLEEKYLKESILNFEKNPLSPSEDLNSKLMSIENQIIQNEKDIILSENLPSIDFETKWGKINPQNNFLRNSFEHQVLLNLTIPLYNGGKFEIKRDILNRELNFKKIEKNQNEIAFKNNYENDLKKITITKKLLQSYISALSQSRRYKEIVFNEFKRGIKNSADLIASSDRILDILLKINKNQFELDLLYLHFNETYFPKT